MEALLACIDEIALDGLDGCPIQQLWKHLEKRKPPFPLKLDNASKQFLWKAIVHTPEVEFYVLTEPFAHIFGAKCDDLSDKAKFKPKNPLDQYQGPLKESNEFKLVSDQDLGIKGSCPNFYVRKNVTQDIQGQAEYLSLENAYERWGDCLVMVASQELREKAILGVHCDPNMTIHDVQYCLLEHVGQARYNGRMQKVIGSNFCKMEPKLLFHYLKRLRELRWITIQPVLITTSDNGIPAFSRHEGGRNFNTNVVRLKRFHVQEHHRYDMLAASLCKLLIEAPNQELSLAKIKEHAGESNKVLKNVRRFLQQAGYVVEERIGDASEEGNGDRPPKKKKKKDNEPSAGTTAYTIKVRLVKPFVIKTDSTWQPSDEDDEDDDDDNDHVDGDSERMGKGSWGDDYQSNLIAERPLMTQVYNAIYQAGSRGCTLKKYQKTCKLPFLDVRSIVRDMKRKNLVQEVHQDFAKTKVAWVVATPLVESNIQTIKVKQLQDQLKQMGVNAVEAQTPDTSPKGSALQSPCSSAAHTEGLEVKEKKPQKGKSLIAERVTYRKLKRKQLILEYIQNMKVVEGSYPFQKAIMASEHEDGYEGKIDRKVIVRFLDDLNAQGLMRKLTTIVRHGTVSQTVDLYLHPSITNDDPKVAQALEQCRTRMTEVCFKVAERQEKARQSAEEKERKKLEKAEAMTEKEKKKLENKEREAKKKAQRGQDKAAKNTDSEQSLASNPTEKTPSYTSCLFPRFYRVQAMHEFLWMLLYGDITQQGSSGAAGHSQANRGLEESLDDNDDWMEYLKPMEEICDGNGEPCQGWFRFCDVLMMMPLTILCRTIDIGEKIEGFDEYAFDPVKKNTLICDLPQPLRSKIKDCRKVRAAPPDLLCNMAHMGLITPTLPFQHAIRNVKIFLNKGIKSLDTTISLPGYHTVCPPPDQSFERRTHLFSSIEAVRNYWRYLKCVCLNTPLGVVRIPGGSGDTGEVTIKGRKLLQFAKEVIDEECIELPPGDNLGAGGLDRSLFSHLQKNWTRLLPRSYVGAVQNKRKLQAPLASKAALVSSVGSSQLPQSNEKRFLSLGKAEMKKLAKKGSEQKTKQKRKAEDSRDSDSVKRARTDSNQKAKTSKQKRDNQGLPPKPRHLTAVDEEDRNILARKANERISFSAEEDSWLLLFRIALGIMKQHETARFHPFVCMRNILSKACAASLDKTAPNLRRRIQTLMKNPHSQMTVKICSAECAQDESFQGFDDSQAEFEVTFKEVVKRLRQKFSSSSLSCDGEFPLVSSVNELHDKYKVQALVSKESQIGLSDEWILSLGPPIRSVSDITKAVLQDQIQIAFTTPQEIYDAYRVFQMFNSFTKEELQDVFKDMQNRGIISRKKQTENPCTHFTRSLPFASITYQLSIIYHRLFLQGLKLATLNREFGHFLTQFVRGEQHTLQRLSTSNGSSTGGAEGANTSRSSSGSSSGGGNGPSTSSSGTSSGSGSGGGNGPSTSSGSYSSSGGADVSTTSSSANQHTLENLTPGTIEVKPKSTVGGHVACILSLLVANKVTVEVNLPDEILHIEEYSELSESAKDTDTEQQTPEDEADSTDVTSSEKSKKKSGSLSTVTDWSGTTKRKAREKSAGRSELSSVTGTTQRHSGEAVQPPPSTKGKVPAEKTSKTKPHAKGKPGATSATTREKKKEEREVFSLKLPASSIVTKFTSASDLKAVKESSSYLTSCTETVEVARPVRKISAVPVASLSHSNFSSRSSRTTLILARGGKDPYDQIKQLPARAFNTHDFMTLTTCKNVLRIRDKSIITSLQNDKDREDRSVSAEPVSETKSEVNVGERISEPSTQTQGATPEIASVPLNDASSDSLTSPAIVSKVMSIEEYIEQRKRESGFNEMDCVLAREIHDLVSEGEELGVPVTWLQERIHESHKGELKSSRYSFEQHVKHLCAGKLLYKVGFCELCLVTAEFIKPWCITLLKPKVNSLEIPVREAGKEQRKSESSQEMAQRDSLGLTGNNTENTTGQTIQTGVKATQLANECGTSSSHSADKTCEKNNETTDQAGLSLESAGGVPTSDKGESKGRRKRCKISNYESYSVVCRPWITINGTTSTQLLSMFKGMVVMLILNNPGIPECEIAKHVFGALRPVALHDILESLLLDECIVKHTRKLPAKVSLFSASKQAGPSQVMTFYTPAVDCLFKLATSKLPGYTS